MSKHTCLCCSRGDDQSLWTFSKVRLEQSVSPLIETGADEANDCDAVFSLLSSVSRSMSSCFERAATVRP